MKKDFPREVRVWRNLAVFFACTAIICAVAGAGILFSQRRGVVAVYAEDVIYTAGEAPLLSYGDIFVAEKSPLVVLCMEAGIFFDMDFEKLIFPFEEFSVAYRYYRRNFFIGFEGAGISSRVVGVTPLGILPMWFFLSEDEIEIRTRRGVFYETGRGESYSYVRFIDPREEFHTIVVLDPGHGGIDTGAPNALGRDAPDESEIVLEISRKVMEIFAEEGVLLLLTRTCDYYVSTSSRARIANAIGDYFISVHCNADAQSNRSRGTLTLYGSAAGSRELAYAFHTALVDALESTDRGFHYAPQFRILRGSQVPVVLLELLFLSNPQDAARLSDPEVQMLIAEVIAHVIGGLPPAR